MENLPLEILRKIFQECDEMSSAVTLSMASKRYQAAWQSLHPVKALHEIAQRQFEPLDVAIQLVTYNDSEPAHLHRYPAISMALLKQVHSVGIVVNKWVEIYPMLRWRSDTSFRRVLRPHEVVRLRRALYEFWLYGKAFHSPAYLSRDEDPPMATADDDRLTFVRRYSNDHIIEICEVHDVFHEMLLNDICPSNAMVKSRYLQAAPGQNPLFFGNYETVHITDTDLESVPTCELPKNLAREAWGSLNSQKAAVLDLLKLTPDQLLRVRDLGNKRDRKAYLNQQDPLFHNNPATLKDALEAVFAERDFFGLGAVLRSDGGLIDYFGEDPNDSASDSDSEDDSEEVHSDDLESYDESFDENDPPGDMDMDDDDELEEAEVDEVMGTAS